MRDFDILTQLLVLERPWVVDEVIFDAKDESIGVFLRHRSDARFRGPTCGAVFSLYDHPPRRKRWHLDHGSWLTWIFASVPRVACLFHGVQRVQLPWALPHSRFTIGFETHAIDTLLEADVLGASRLLRLSWDETWGLMTRAVTRGLNAKRRRVIPYLAVDEKSLAKRHRYVTLVGDPGRGTIEFVSVYREKSSSDAFDQSLSPKQLAGIEPWPWTRGSRTAPRPTTAPKFPLPGGLKWPPYSPMAPLLQTRGPACEGGPSDRSKLSLLWCAIADPQQPAFTDTSQRSLLARRISLITRSPRLGFREPEPVFAAHPTPWDELVIDLNATDDPTLRLARWIS